MEETIVFCFGCVAVESLAVESAAVESAAVEKKAVQCKCISHANNAMMQKN